MNRSRILWAVSVGAILLFGCATPALCQDTDDIQQGIKAYGTYRGGDIDLVSMTNGSLTLNIPLVSYPQRGKLHLGYELVYNRKNYINKTQCIIDTCTEHAILNTFGSPLIAVSDRGFTAKVTTVAELGNPNVLVGWYSLVSPDGGSHILGEVSSTDYETVDGTGLYTNNPSVGAVAYDSDGSKIGTYGMLEDTNGNQLAWSGSNVTDSVGRSIAYPPQQFMGSSNGAGTCPTGPLPVYGNTTWSVPGPAGGTTNFVFCWAKVNVVINYDLSDGTQVWSEQSYLQSIVLSNGTNWTFQYSSDGNGDLTEITLPTGGTITYGWTDAGSCSGAWKYPRAVASRSVNANDGTGSHQWTYSGLWTYQNGSAATVTDPLGNNIVYTVAGFGVCQSYVTAVNYYQGAVQSSNLLKTVTTTYSTTPSPFGQDVGQNSMNIVPTQVTTAWANGKTSQVTNSYDSGFSFMSPRPNDNTLFTGLYGKVTVEKEYDYGSGSPGLLVKQTNTSYMWQSPNPNHSSYLGNNMLNLVYSTQITDGTTQKAYTQYGYDETSTIASGLGASQNLDTSVWTGM
jgi:hypothetical protein